MNVGRVGNLIGLLDQVSCVYLVIEPNDNFLQPT